MRDEPAFPSLAEPPTDGVWAAAAPRLLTLFKALNRWFMVPAHHAGLGAWVSTPIGGWILLLRVRGRKSGVIRETPLNYLIEDGSVWVMAGFGRRSEWYRNLLADPSVEVRLPGRRFACTANEVRDPDARARMIPRLVRATGLPGTMVVPAPWIAPSTPCRGCRWSGCARETTRRSWPGRTTRAGSGGSGGRRPSWPRRSLRDG